MQGDKNAADQAAVDMMRKVLATVSMDGVVVIGEGEKDVRPIDTFCIHIDMCKLPGHSVFLPWLWSTGASAVVSSTGLSPTSQMTRLSSLQLLRPHSLSQLWEGACHSCIL